ncbi:hypothetical protein [Corynebacterium qintianiae]|uniref:hypothetical protein n=1 Tax=Corynebacterium qintianiae TaxID=2709392 RepID=UPI0013EDA448|nr:hypothetical protein [Corynebacterium qintianiae]
MATNNSYFDALEVLSAEDILASSELLQAAAEEQLAGTQAYDLLFTPHNVNNLTVGYNLDAAPGLDEAVQRVPEFNEIPVGDPHAGERKYADLAKMAIGLRVSYEQRNFGTGADIQRELIGRIAEIRRANSDAAVAALEAASIEELPAAATWNTEGAAAVDDLFAADDLLAGATDANGNLFNYSAGYVWANRKTLNALKRNKQTTDLYTGDMAHANPLFAGIEQQPLIAEQFQLVADQALPDGVAYVFAASEYGSIGTRFQTGDPIFTDWYEEHGQSGYGGSTMSWRSDWVHWRDLAVRAPKGAVKITGAI